MATPISEITLKINNRDYIYALKEAERETKRFGDAVEDTGRRANLANTQMNNSASQLATGFGKLRTALVGVGIAAFVADTARAADSVVDLSKAVDMSVGSILELRLALQQSGGEAKDADKIIVEFLKSINEFAQGNDAAVEAFRKLGIGAKELTTLTPEEVFRKAIEGLNGIGDAGERAAIKQQIFSKALATVSADDLNESLKRLQGTQDSNAQSQLAMAKAVDQAQEVFNKLQIAVAKAIAPLLDFFEKSGDWGIQTDKLAKALQVLAAAFAALYAADKVAKGINFMIDASKILLSLSKSRLATEVAIQAVGEVAKGGAKGATRGGVGGAIVGAAAGIGAVITATEIYKAITELFDVNMRDIMPGTSEAGAGRGFINPPLVGSTGKASGQPAITGAITPPKELTSQLSAVQGIADAYKRASENARQKLILDAESLTLTEQEAARRRGIADITNKAAEAIGRLEEKRAGAKGQTLELIDKEIANVKRARDAEIEQFNITNERVFAKKREELVTKALLEQEELRVEYAREMAAYQDQIGRSIVQAFEQTKQIQDQLALTTEQEKLERSIRNMRGEDQKYTRDIFNLEVERKRNLDAIAKIPDLPYAERLKKEEEINAAYKARKTNLEEMYVQDKVNQDSFVYGWTDALDKWRNNLQTDAERAGEIFGTLTRGFEDSIVKFVQTGKLSFRSLFNDLIAQAVRASANRLLMSILGAGGTGLFGSGGLFGGKIIPGFLAEGGPAQAGKPYIVGEKGPELFVPNRSGTVIPNGTAIGGGGTSVTNVNYNIQAVDAASFRSLVARDPEFIYSVTEQGRRQLPIRSRR